MTHQELAKAIDLLNQKYQGQVMLPYNYPIKEFVAAPIYIDKFTNFHIAYVQSMGDIARALAVVPNEDMMIYAVFNAGTFPNFNTEEYIFKKFHDFIADNGIDQQELLNSLAKN